MNIVVVYNPKSGSALPKRELKRLFDKAAITVVAWVDVTHHVEKNLKKWADKGMVIAAIGGDGTIASVAGVVAGTRATLAPLPGGTLNHFTKDVGVTQDLSEAINRLPAAKPRYVDIATVNGDVFLNTSSIGIYPLSLRTREQIEGTLGKWPAAVIASTRALIKFNLYEVTLDDRTFKTPFVFVGNNEYSLGRGVVRSSLDKGVLCVYTVKSDKRRTLVELLFSALAGRLEQRDDLITMTTSALTIQTDRDMVQVSTDGEVMRRSAPLIYRSVPRGLKIIGS